MKILELVSTLSVSFILIYHQQLVFVKLYLNWMKPECDIH